VRLSDLGEFGFIKRMRSWLPPSSPSTTVVGIGDDAAVVATRRSRLVASADALVEGVHFRLDWSTAADVGFKAASVNVSDIAAMGAEPRWLLVVVAAPADTTLEVLEGIYEGIAEAGALYGTELVGGDTVRSSEIVLAVTALGELDGEPMTRTGARPGDVLAVTGPLGRAAAGVNLLLSNDPKVVSPDDALACIDAHRRPIARVGEGIRLRDAGVRTAIDVSDGLASDAIRLAEASGVGVEIDGARLPIAPEVAAVAQARGWDAAKIVLGGGEDLELLVAIPEGSDVAGLGLIECGRVVRDGAWLVSDGERLELAAVGYDHFKVKP
jgi:thiamine-monophosphate kinase